MQLRHRQRAQITPLALYAMLILVGTLSLVVDAGVFFVTQRQLQTAVDAAALAAVWYTPVCNPAIFAGPDCQSTAPSLPPRPPGWSCSSPAECVAEAVAQQNLAFVGALCRDFPTFTWSTVVPPPPAPTLTYDLVTVDCDAPYWFARVFPSIPATAHIRAFARATIGYATTTGVSPTGPGNLVSRLVS